MNHLSETQSKVVAVSKLSELVAGHRSKGMKIGFTNGCFDILHPGHVQYLAHAASMCDFLIVGVNSDASVKSLAKGIDRPVNHESARSLVLAGLASVGAVIIFNEHTPLSLIEQLTPDLLFKGADYDPNETNPSSRKYIVGREPVLSRGGKVIAIPLVEGFSTTSIIQKLKK